MHVIANKRIFKTVRVLHYLGTENFLMFLNGKILFDPHRMQRLSHDGLTCSLSKLDKSTINDKTSSDTLENNVPKHIGVLIKLQKYLSISIKCLLTT